MSSRRNILRFDPVYFDVLRSMDIIKRDDPNEPNNLMLRRLLQSELLVAEAPDGAEDLVTPVDEHVHRID